MRATVLIITPYIIVWLLTRSRRAFRWILLIALLTVLLFAILPLVIIAYKVINEPAPIASTMRLAGLYDNFSVTNSQLHGLSGWEGVDIKAGCGKPIYAPFDGAITFIGMDGYNHLGVYEQATMLTIKGDGLELTLLHGDYPLPVGLPVERGDIIGRENTHGWSTGCHSHVILKENARILNYLEWLPSYHADYPLRISWYDPSLGGTNGKRPEANEDGISFVTPDAWRTLPSVLRRYEQMVFCRDVAGKDAQSRILGVGHPLIDHALQQAKDFDVKVAAVSGLACILVVFLAFERVTTGKGQVKRLLLGVEHPVDGELRVVRDVDVLRALNASKLQRSDRPEGMRLNLPAPELIERSRRRVESHIAETGLPFVAPAVAIHSILLPLSV